MNFNIKKEKRYQYFAPDNASTIPFSIALNNHITYLNKKFEDLVLLCIGTDKITGDCLGPLVGSKLKQRKFPYPLYGTKNHIGLVSLSRQPLSPGKGVARPLCPVGDISITGIINEASVSSEILLPYTSLYLVDKLAEYICKGILNSDLPQAR